MLLQITDMLIQQMLTGLGILLAVQLSRDMFECSVDITWYTIFLIQTYNHRIVVIKDHVFKLENG